MMNEFLLLSHFMKVFSDLSLISIELLHNVAQINLVQNMDNKNCEFSITNYNISLKLYTDLGTYRRYKNHSVLPP